MRNEIKSVDASATNGRMEWETPVLLRMDAADAQHKLMLPPEGNHNVTSHS